MTSRRKRRAHEEDLMRDPQGVAQEVLNRMSINHEAGRGISLTAAELHAISVTQIGALWAQEYPGEE